MPSEEALKEGPTGEGQLGHRHREGSHTTEEYRTAHTEMEASATIEQS